MKLRICHVTAELAPFAKTGGPGRRRRRAPAPARPGRPRRAALPAHVRARAPGPVAADPGAAAAGPAAARRRAHLPRLGLDHAAARRRARRVAGALPRALRRRRDLPGRRRRRAALHGPRARRARVLPVPAVGAAGRPLPRLARRAGAAAAARALRLGPDVRGHAHAAHDPQHRLPGRLPGQHAGGAGAGRRARAVPPGRPRRRPLRLPEDRRELDPPYHDLAVELRAPSPGRLAGGRESSPRATASRRGGCALHHPLRHRLVAGEHVVKLTAPLWRAELAAEVAGLARVPGGSRSPRRRSSHRRARRLALRRHDSRAGVGRSARVALARSTRAPARRRRARSTPALAARARRRGRARRVGRLLAHVPDRRPRGTSRAELPRARCGDRAVPRAPRRARPSRYGSCTPRSSTCTCWSRPSGTAVEPRALLDFADSRLGAVEYEFAAPVEFLFRGEPGVLRAFLVGYGADAARSTRRAPERCSPGRCATASAAWRGCSRRRPGPRARSRRWRGRGREARGARTGPRAPRRAALPPLRTVRAMHVVFVEPSFPRNQRDFVRALTSVGTRVTGIGETPADGLDGELRGRLHGYGSRCAR